MRRSCYAGQGGELYLPVATLTRLTDWKGRAMGLDLPADVILDKLLVVAKAQRASIPYSKDEGMPLTLVVIGPTGEVETVPITWRSEREKYAKMKAVSETAKETFCSAVVMISDAQWTNSQEFSAYFHLPPISEIGLEGYKKEYTTIVNGIYGGLIKNLPRELWTEAVVLAIKGPRIPCTLRMAPYIEGPHDSIQFVETKDKLSMDTVAFNLLPDWWV